MKTLVTREVADLIPYACNARTHGEAQVAQIAVSIKEFGFTNPLLIDEHGTIIAGQGRALAAKTLKITTVPCIVLTGLTDAQKAAYAIADNKLGLNATWDDEVLCAELTRLGDLQYDVNLTGFSEVEITTLLEKLDVDMPDATGVITLIPPTVETVTDAPATITLLPATADTNSAPVTEVSLVFAKPASEDTRHWVGMPDYQQPDAGPFRTIAVHFKDQASVDAFAKLIGQSLTDKTKWVWYPEVAKVASGKVYA